MFTLDPLIILTDKSAAFGVLDQGCWFSGLRNGMVDPHPHASLQFKAEMEGHRRHVKATSQHVLKAFWADASLDRGVHLRKLVLRS